MDYTKLSRSVSYILRHAPQEYGLKLIIYLFFLTKPSVVNTTPPKASSIIPKSISKIAPKPPVISSKSSVHMIM